MKKMYSAALLAVATLGLGTQAVHAATVDVSINIGQPGYYGPLDIRDFGRPQLIYSEPRVIYRTAVQREPVYLHVPPGHAKNWRKHCGKYNACGDRVYFVKDSWYDREYVPRYQAKHNRGERHDDHRGGHDSNDKHDKHDMKNQGKGKGNGKNH